MEETPTVPAAEATPERLAPEPTISDVKDAENTGGRKNLKG